MVRQQEQQKYSNQIQNLYHLAQNFSSKNFQKHSKRCFYRQESTPKSIKVVSIQQQAKQKQCQYRQINNQPSYNQSQQFKQYTKQFYSHQFLKYICQNDHALVQLYHNCSTRNNSVYNSLKKEEGTIQSSSYQPMNSINDCLTNQELLYSMTSYLESIKPRFLNFFSPYSDEAIMLNVKEGCQIFLHEYVDLIFQKFYTAAVRKVKNKCKFANTLQISKRQRQTDKNEEEKILKAQTQSEYHNFKNSFMHIITQLACPQILDCFNISQYEKNSLVEIIARLKENSVKFRPVKGKYYYYSNIHYITLFFKYYETNFNELKRSSQIQDLHSKIFKLNAQESQNQSFTEILKINYLKSIFGQIIIQCLEIAESQISGNSNYKNNVSNDNNLKSRYFYISKVKKGIQKLLQGKKVKRF
ncbi:hypothetical protein ABPG72_012030 [Tetrahymena utriculariae]